MSGTAGHAIRQQTIRAEKIEIRRQFLQRLYQNRSELMTAVNAYFVQKFGDGTFDAEHPLVKAVNTSAAGGIIDIEKLAEKIEEYDGIQITQ